ncbi:MAG: hypothetical protein H0X67_16815 [Acidobacteria bacterium]|nr:hypothetical protein [Acidobacteriota bacterium]
MISSDEHTAVVGEPGQDRVAAVGSVGDPLRGGQGRGVLLQALDAE